MIQHNLNADEIRKKTIDFSCKTKAGHLAPSLSSVEYLTVLFRDFMQFDPKNAKNDKRDRLIFSKGHGAYAYYVILNQLGFIPDEVLWSFNTKDSLLKGCLVENKDFMIEASTGSLGHGLPIAVGIALAMKMQKKPNKVICIVGDGEMQEGSNFEALGLANRFKLNNLLLIVDANNLQAMDFVQDVALDNKKLSKILSIYTSPENFFDIDGHCEKELHKTFFSFFNETKKEMSIVFCQTVKGCGISIIENQAKYHYRCLDEQELNGAIR